MNEEVKYYKPTPAMRWVKFWDGRKYTKRLEQRYLEKDTEKEHWIEVPTFLEEKTNN